MKMKFLVLTQDKQLLNYAKPYISGLQEGDIYNASSYADAQDKFLTMEPDVIVVDPHFIPDAVTLMALRKHEARVMVITEGFLIEADPLQKLGTVYFLKERYVSRDSKKEDEENKDLVEEIMRIFLRSLGINSVGYGNTYRLTYTEKPVQKLIPNVMVLCKDRELGKELAACLNSIGIDARASTRLKLKKRFEKQQPNVIVTQGYEPEEIFPTTGSKTNTRHLFLSPEVCHFMAVLRKHDRKERLTETVGNTAKAIQAVLERVIHDSENGIVTTPLLHMIEFHEIDVPVFEILQTPKITKMGRDIGKKEIILFLHDNPFAERVKTWIMETLKIGNVTVSNDLETAKRLYGAIQPDILISEMCFYEEVNDVIGNDFSARIITLTAVPWEKLGEDEEYRDYACKQPITGGLDVETGIKKCLDKVLAIDSKTPSIRSYAYIKQPVAAYEANLNVLATIPYFSEPRNKK